LKGENMSKEDNEMTFEEWLTNNEPDYQED
jgi:hypothetical protein